MGCTVVKEDLASGKVLEDKDVSIITSYGEYKHTCYYLHLPETGAIEIVTVNGKISELRRQCTIHRSVLFTLTFLNNHVASSAHYNRNEQLS